MAFLTCLVGGIKVTGDPAGDGREIEVYAGARLHFDVDVAGDRVQVGVAAGEAVDQDPAAGGPGRDRCVGEGDRAFIEQMLSAYDTEKRLQTEALAPAFSIEDLVIEAGPTYFDDAAKQVGEGIASMTAVLAQRNAAPYSSATKQ